MAKWNINTNFDEKVILESLGDPEKRKILKAVFDSSKISIVIITECDIAITSGYRKIKQMIDNGLLVENGFEIPICGPKVPKYQTSFDNVIINIKMRKKF